MRVSAKLALPKEIVANIAIESAMPGPYNGNRVSSVAIGRKSARLNRKCDLEDIPW